MAANGIPDIPRPRSNDPETQRFYDAVSNAFRSIQRTDNQGLVTYDELGRRLLPLYNDYKVLSSKVGGGEGCEGASVPAAVSNITADGAFGIITIKWDMPIYRGHGHTEVWVSKANDFATAEKAGETPGDLAYFEHAVPAIEFTTENNYEVTRYYWLRHVSRCSKGEGPWSDAVEGKTPASPSLIGELMAKNADAMIQSLGLDQDLSALADGISEVRTVAQSAVTKADAVKLTADNAYAAVQTKAEASTVAGLDGRLNTVQAKYTVQTDVNGYVQGFGLLNTGSPTTSGMAFNVNNFYVTNTVNGTKNKPFMIEGNKVYADNLFVRQANIEKLNVMDIATSGIIKSANYVAGSSGWKIDNAGNAEFNTVQIRVPSSGVSGSFGKSFSGIVSPTGLSSTWWTVIAAAYIQKPETKYFDVVATGVASHGGFCADRDMILAIRFTDIYGNPVYTSPEFAVAGISVCALTGTAVGVGKMYSADGYVQLLCRVAFGDKNLNITSGAVVATTQGYN